MNEHERPKPIDGAEGTHEVDDQVANPDVQEPGEEEVLPADAVAGMTAEELEKGAQEKETEE